MAVREAQTATQGLWREIMMLQKSPSIGEYRLLTWLIIAA